MGPRYDQVPRDCQNLFALTRFRYIKVLFHIFYYYWKIVRYTERGLRYTEVRYIEVPLYIDIQTRHCIDEVYNPTLSRK